MHLISLWLTPVPLIKDFRLPLDFHFREKLTSIKLTIERLLIRTNCFPFFTLHFLRSVMQFCPDWTIECDLKRVVRNHRHAISEAVVIWSPSFSKHEKGDKKCLIMSPSGVRCNQWGSAKGEQTLKNQVRFDLPAHTFFYSFPKRANVAFSKRFPHRITNGECHENMLLVHCFPALWKQK